MTTPVIDRPRVFDNKRGAVLVTWNGRQVRGYSYQNDEERRLKIRLAHEFIEGWIEGRDHGLDMGYDKHDRAVR